MAKKTLVLKYLPAINSNLLDEFRRNKNKKYPMRIFPTDDMRLEIGFGLIPLVNNIIVGIQNIRKNIEEEIGISFPLVHTVDNLDLANYEYCIKFRNEILCKYRIPKNKYLCIDKGNIKNKIAGKNIKDPVFGIPALLINKEDLDIAKKSGYTIVDASGIILTHLTHIIESNIDKIFSYDNSKNILIEIAKKSPLLVEDVKKIYKDIEIKQILERLLIKNIPLLNIKKILELMIVNEKYKNNLDKLVENIILKLRGGFMAMLKTEHYNISCTDLLPDVIDFPIELIEGLTEKLTIKDNASNLNDVFKWASLGKKILEKYGEMSNPEIQRFKSKLAWVLLDMSEDEMALEIANSLIKSLENIKEESDKVVSSYYRLLSFAQNGCGDSDDALENINKAISINENNHSNYHVMGEIFINKDEFEKAENALKIALEKSINENGEDDPNTALIYQSYSQLYWETKQEDKCFKYAKKAYKIMKKHLGEENFCTMRCSNHLGAYLFLKCQYKESLERIKKSDEILGTILGERHTITLSVKENIGCTLVKINDYNEAFNYFENLLFITNNADLLLVLSYCNVTMYAPTLVCIINIKQFSDKIILNDNTAYINSEELGNGIYNECELFDVIPEKYWKEVAGIYAKQMVTKKRYIRT